MNRRIAVLFVILFLSVGFCTKKVEGPEKSLLWEITQQGETSYILGSIHVFKEEWYPLRDVIEESFAQSDVLVLETDLSKEKQAEYATLMMQLGLYRGEETLKKSISPEVYQKTKKLLKREYDLDIQLYEKFKPWYLSLMLSLMEIQKMGFKPEFGIDQYFYKHAMGKKEIIGLETIDLYVKLFGKISGEDQEKFLDYTLKDLKKMRKDLKKLTHMWQHGDLSGIEQLTLEIYEKDDEFLFLKKLLLDDRNVTMAEGIIGLMVNSDKKNFFIVGAAHLFGETGILQALEKNGYTLKQL